MKDDHRYLWDGSGPPDPEVARLEALLAPLRYRDRPPLGAVRRRRPATALRRVWLAAAMAAGILLAAGLTAWTLLAPRSGWWVQALAGTPRIEGREIGGNGRIRIGQWLVTDGAALARLSIGRIGAVVVAQNSQVQLVASSGREHRIALERGSIQARIFAPPRYFFVNTPSAVAVDLGCAYTLTVDEQGRGLLRVTDGWVALEHAGTQSLIPQGAMCLTFPNAPPGTPRYDDAPSGYATALATLDFGGVDNPLRAEAFNLVLSSARRRDALTLWHMLSRGTPAERARVYDRLAALAPPPTETTRDAVLSGDRRAINSWWDSLGVETGSWWKLWKTKARP